MYEAFLIFYLNEESGMLFLFPSDQKEDVFNLFGDKRRGVLHPEVK